MDITPPASDKGTQRLKLENENKTVKPTTAVVAYPRIQSSEEEHERAQPETIERRKYRRRTEDRRHEHSPTLFDTRSGQERRSTRRREVERQAPPGEEESPAANTAKGIDELA